MSSPPTLAKPPFGDLYVLPISPWSIRVLLTLKHARVEVNVNEYKPVLSEYAIWIRLGFAKRTITAPALLRPQQDCLMDSHAIARQLDAGRPADVTTLFPDGEDDALLRRLVTQADAMQNFSRGESLAFMENNPAFAVKTMMPPLIQKMPFANALAKFSIRRFAAKFSEQSRAATSDLAKVALREMSEAVKKAEAVDGVKYIVGGQLTYADFAVCMSLPFVMDENSPFKEVPSSLDMSECPELKEYCLAIKEKHMTALDLSFPPPKYDSKGKII